MTTASIVHITAAMPQCSPGTLSLVGFWLLKDLGIGWLNPCDQDHCLVYVVSPYPHDICHSHSIHLNHIDQINISLIRNIFTNRVANKRVQSSTSRFFLFYYFIMQNLMSSSMGTARLSRVPNRQKCQTSEGKGCENGGQKPGNFDPWILGK